MDIVQAILLGLIQGVTEFLPVSSSGHLALLHDFFGEINVGFDVLIHLATLLSIIIYFSKDLVLIAKDFFSFKTDSQNFRLVIYLVFASIPIAILGFFFRNLIDNIFANLLIVSFGFFISGMFLFTAGFSHNNKKINALSGFVVGLSQALAIIPGVSRSGATVSTGVLLGVERKNAIRFSFLLAIPAIIGANLLKINEILNLNFGIALTGFIAAFIAGFISIFVFIRYIKLENFKWLAFYCFVLAVISFLTYVL